MSSVFISFVGLRPAAVAVPLVSWIKAKQNTPSHILLLATKRSEEIANRLCKWISQRYGPLNCKVIITTSTPVEAIKEWMEHTFFDGEGLIIFNAVPGPNFLVALVSRMLSSKNSIFLYSMAEKLHIHTGRHGKEGWEEIELADIGLKSLLELCGVKFEEIERGELPVQVEVGNLAGLKLFKDDNVYYKFELAFEKGGYLHVLSLVNQKNALQRIRDLQRVQNEFGGLQIRIAVLSSNKSVLDRAREAGFLAINSESKQGRNRLRKWINREIPPPGRQKSSRRRGEVRCQVRRDTLKGKGGSNSPLALCLGTDPSSTLVSLCTHRPMKAWIFYDAGTPTVVEVARRLAENIGDLPVGEAELIPTDHLGRGICETMADRAKDYERVKVDISPGTKAQGCALTKIKKAEIWSLTAHQGEARCISDPSQPSLKLQAPDILTQARIVGGELKREGEGENHLKEQKGFLKLLLDFLNHYISEHRWQGVSLYVECEHGAIRRERKQVAVEFPFGKERKGNLPEEGGYWLEILAAYALMRIAEEVRYGIKWSWSSNELKGASFRDEIDVLAKLGHRFVAVSCKAGKNVSLTRAKREIEAVASLCMGRFCLPLLVRPRYDYIKESIESKRGAAILDIRYLADTRKLKETLEEIFRNRSAFSS